MLGVLVERDTHSSEACQLKELDISIAQHELLIYGTLTQIYHNSSSSSIEASYIFSNDNKFCIYGTSFTINNVTTEMKMKLQDEADQMYNEAKNKGIRAVKSQKLPNGLTKISISDIPANTDCIVTTKIALISNMETNKSLFCKIPLNICSPTLKSIDLSGALTGSLKMTVKSMNKAKIEANLEGLFNSETSTFTSNTANLNPSLFLRFQLENPISKSALHSEGYAFCSVFQTIPRPLDYKSDFAFVVDCSGSMSGSRIKKAQECLNFFLQSLPIGCKFQVLRFGSDMQSTFTDFVEYNENNLKTAKAVADNLRADLGGTNIYAPLKSLIRSENRTRPMQIFLITDGDSGDADLCMSEAYYGKNKCRIFTIGIGTGVDHGLISGLADITEASALYVSEEDDLTEKVMNLLELSLSPSAGIIDIGLDSTESFNIVPFPLTTLFDSQPLSFAVKYDIAQGTPNIMMTLDDQGKNPSIILENQPFEDPSVLKAFYSYNNMFHLEMMFAERRKQGDKNIVEIKNTIIAESIENGIPSMFTTYVGIQKSKERDYSNCYDPTIEDFDECSDDDCDGESMGADTVDMFSVYSKVSYADYDDACEEICLECNDERKEICPGECFESAENEKQDRQLPVYSEPVREAPKKVNSLQDFIGLQSFDGSWSSVDSILSYCSFTDISFMSSYDQTVQATLLAVAILRHMYADRIDSWKFIEKKALNYLSSKIPSNEIQPTLARILSSMSN